MEIHRKGSNVERYGEDRAKKIAEKRSNSLKGDRNGMFGKTITEEHKQKMIEANKKRDYHFSESHKSKIKEALTGKKDSDEIRQKKKEAAKTRKQWTGKKNCKVFDSENRLIGTYSVAELCKLYETNRNSIYRNKIPNLNITIDGSI